MSEETYNRDPTKQLNIVSTASAAQGETVPVEFSARQSNFSDKHSTEPRPGRLVESCSLSSVHPQQFITNYISFLVRLAFLLIEFYLMRFRFRWNGLGKQQENTFRRHRR